MGALANAVVLLRDPDFRDWCLAAGAYQARVVITELGTVPDHDIRLRLAVDVLSCPEVVVDKLVTAIATDPDVAGKGSTTAAVGEALALSKTAAVWTTLAKIGYPNN